MAESNTVHGSQTHDQKVMGKCCRFDMEWYSLLATKAKFCRVGNSIYLGCFEQSFLLAPPNFVYTPGARGRGKVSSYQLISFLYSYSPSASSSWSIHSVSTPAQGKEARTVGEMAAGTILWQRISDCSKFFHQWRNGTSYWGTGVLIEAQFVPVLVSVNEFAIYRQLMSVWKS